MKTLFSILALSCAALAGTIFLGAYPDSVMVFDEAKGKIVENDSADHRPAHQHAALSTDRKKIYVTTNDHSGLEVIDVATRKVINHFVLNTPPSATVSTAAWPIPEGKLFYTVTTEMNKLTIATRSASSSTP